MVIGLCTTRNVDVDVGLSVGIGVTTAAKVSALFRKDLGLSLR